MPKGKTSWPQELIDAINEYVDSHLPLDGGSSYSTKVHEDLLHLQKVARENNESEEDFLQCLSLFSPLLVNEEQLREWFRAYANPSINSAGHRNEAVEASRTFMLSVMTKGVYPLFNRKQSQPVSTQDLIASSTQSAIASIKSSFTAPTSPLTSLTSPISSTTKSIATPLSKLLDTPISRPPSASASITPSLHTQDNDTLHSTPSVATIQKDDISIHDKSPNPITASTILSPTNPALSPLINPLASPSVANTIATSTISTVTEDPNDFETASYLYFSLILDIFLGINLNEWFSFTETGLDLEERLRVVAKGSRDLLLIWGGKNEKQFFQRLNIRAVDPKHRQLSFNLLSVFISQNLSSNLGAIANTGLLDTLLNSLLYDISATLLNIGSKILAMLIPYIATKLKPENIFKFFLIYGRLACWNTFKYDFTLPRSLQQIDTASIFTEDSLDTAATSTTADQRLDEHLKLIVPKGWRLMSKAFDLPDVQLVDIAPLFSSIYGLWPSNFMTFVRKPSEFISINCFQNLETQSKLSKPNVPLPDGWNDSLINERSQQIFCSHSVNPILARFSPEVELDPRASESLGSPEDIAAFCVSLRERFKDVLPQSRRQSSFAVKSQSQSQSQPQPPSQSQSQSQLQRQGQPLPYQYPHHPSDSPLRTNDEMPYLNALFGSDSNLESIDGEVSLDRPRDVFGNDKLSEVPLIASPITYRRNSETFMGTPNSPYPAALTKETDDLLDEHRNLFTRKDERKRVFSGADLVPDNFSLNDPSPTSNTSSGSSATVPSSFLSPSITAHMHSPLSASPRSRPLTDLLNSPMLLGQAAPSSSLTHVVVNSPTVGSVGASQPSSTEPEPMKLSPTLKSNPPPVVSESLSLQTVRGSPRLATQTHTPVMFKNTGKPLVTQVGQSPADTTTLFYHREFSILRNEFDYISFCDYHTRYQLRELQKARVTDLAFLQKVDQLSMANNTLHDRTKELNQKIQAIEAELSIVRVKQQEAENRAISRKETLQIRCDELEKSLSTLQVEHQKLTASHDELLKVILKKEEKLSYLELKVEDLSKDKTMAEGYKKSLAELEKEKQELEKKTENHITLEESYASENLLTRVKELSLARVAAENAKEISDRKLRIQINSLQAMLKDAQEKQAKPSKLWIESFEAQIQNFRQEIADVKQAYKELSVQYAASNQQLSSYFLQKESKINYAKGRRHMLNNQYTDDSFTPESNSRKELGSPEAEMVPMFDFIESESLDSSVNSQISSPRMSMASPASPVNTQHGPDAMDPLKRHSQSGSSGSATKRSPQQQQQQQSRIRGRGGVQNSMHGQSGGTPNRTYRGIM